MRNALASEILTLLANGKVIRDVRVIEPINFDQLAEDEKFYQPIDIIDCHFHSLDAINIQFHELVTLKNSVIENSSFTFSYFLKGVSIEGCLFHGETDFQCGVHNQNGYCFTLRNSTFKEFVNFFDCKFEGPVEITDCKFEGGTNLLGNKIAPYQVTFVIPPQIENNHGDLELNGG